MEHIPHAFGKFLDAYMRTSWMIRQVYGSMQLCTCNNRSMSVDKHLHRFTKRYLLHPSALPIEQDLNNLKKQNIKGAVKNLFSLINEYMK